MPEAEPPHRQFAEPVDRAWADANGTPLSVRITRGSPNSLKVRSNTVKANFSCVVDERLAGQQVAAGEIGDRQRIAVPPIAEHELAFVVGAPERVRLGRPRQLGAGGARPAPAPAVHQAVPIEHRVDGADRRQVRRR